MAFVRINRLFSPHKLALRDLVRRTPLHPVKKEEYRSVQWYVGKPLVLRENKIFNKTLLLTVSWVARIIPLTLLVEIFNSSRLAT